MIFSLTVGVYDFAGAGYAAICWLTSQPGKTVILQPLFFF
jgi:hypothetical protein